MAQEKPKGNIFYEILIVILTVVLVASIIYPKKIQEEEELNTQLAHYRMDEIFKAELQYQKYNSRYNDTLSVVLDFIQNDPRYATWVDSVIIGKLDTVLSRLNQFRRQEDFIRATVATTQDSAMFDSLAKMQFDMKFASRELSSQIESINDQMKLLPNMPLADLVAVFKVVDSKQFTLDMDIVRNSILSRDVLTAQTGATDMTTIIDQVADQFVAIKNKVPEYKSSSLDEIAYCPSTGKEFELVYIDTSAIKYINIYSPIDSSDIARAASDFLKSKIGGYKLENHGKIESGEKSWEGQ